MKPLNANLFFLASLALTTACGNSSNNDDPDPATETMTRIPVTVIDYRPAPGQFINELPECDAETASSFNPVAEAQSYIDDGTPVSLGSLGGYIILKTSKAITGRFRVIGNALESGGGEPGIVSLSTDGKSWYDIEGEHYSEAVSTTVTYTTTESGEIKFVASAGVEGVIPQNKFHAQSYYPLWESATSITFSCLRLPDNGHFDQTTGNYILDKYWGYADSYANRDDRSILDIKDCSNQSIKSFSYVKITSAILQVNGDLGECSTEVAGIEIPQ